MPIVKNTLIGDSQTASAQSVTEIPFALPLGALFTITTDQIAGSGSPLRVKGLPILAFQIQVTGGTCANIVFTPEASIQVGGGAGALRFFDLNNGVIVPNGGFQLLQFTVPVDYVRGRLSVTAPLTATGFIRIMTAG